MPFKVGNNESDAYLGRFGEALGGPARHGTKLRRRIGIGVATIGLAAANRRRSVDESGAARLDRRKQAFLLRVEAVEAGAFDGGWQRTQTGSDAIDLPGKMPAFVVPASLVAVAPETAAPLGELPLLFGGQRLQGLPGIEPPGFDQRVGFLRTAVMMKITSNTSMTSISGVMLMSAMGVAPGVRSRRPKLMAW